MKSFKGCIFKLHLPTCVTFDKTAEFKCKFVFGEKRESIVFSKARLINIFNEISQADIDMPITNEKSSHSLNFSITGNKSVFLKNAKLEMTFLQENGQKILVSYLFKNSQEVLLDNVKAETMTEAEENRYSNAFEVDPIPPYVPPYPPIQPIPIIGVPEELVPYMEALKKEKKFLIANGGKKYKVSNGRYIDKVDNRYSYIFDMEAELHLSDDAPIILCVGLEKTSGTVMLCEDFQIVVVVKSFMGQHISSGIINVEPWKLLEALADRVMYGLQNNSKMINKIIGGSELSTSRPIEEIPKGQDEAKRRALNDPVTIIWGPPGTGKTYTMAEVAISYMTQKKSVLIVSHSNVSVDGITKQIGGIFRDKHSLDVLKKGMVLRYGYIRDDELRKDKYLSSFAFAVSKDPSIESKLDSLQKEYEKVKAISGITSTKLPELQKKIKDTRAVIKKTEKECVQKALVVSTTISKAIMDTSFTERLFDVVIFDEVSMANVLQIMSAASFAKEHMICVGDFMQLSTIVQSDAVKLGEDIFDYLGINVHGKPYYHPWLVMLDEQRRMAPAISKFSSVNVYKRLLKDHISVVEDTNKSLTAIAKQEMFPYDPINLIDLASTYCASSKNSDGSRYNILSGILAFSIAIKCEPNVKSISVITPYVAQTRLVRALTIDYRKNIDTSLRCATVHQFQGSESDVVIFDAVESYPGLKPGWLMSKDLNSIKRLINVAVTRAKGKLVVVANKRFWDENYKANPNHTFYRLINYLSQNGNVIQHKENKTLGKMVSELSVKGGPQYYLDNKYFEDLLKDIEKAKRRIIVSLPSGSLDNEVEKKIFDALITAKGNGVTILSKCNDYASLPEHWKNITWGTKNAVFPLLVIDDKTVWYGVPFADWKFALKNNLFLGSPCKIACRVKGENTAEIIRSLSDLDFRESGAGRIPLVEKTNGGDDSPERSFVEYASHLRKCPECGEYMKMTRGRSGTVILWCKDCKKIDLLSIDEVNQYINKYRVKCPDHMCDIEARIGKRGLYIRCENGCYIRLENI